MEKTSHLLQMYYKQLNARTFQIGLCIDPQMATHRHIDTLGPSHRTMGESPEMAKWLIANGQWILKSDRADRADRADRVLTRTAEVSVEYCWRLGAW